MRRRDFIRSAAAAVATCAAPLPTAAAVTGPAFPAYATSVWIDWSRFSQGEIEAALGIWSWKMKRKHTDYVEVADG